MPAGIPTPYDNKIQRLRERLDKKPGKNPHLQYKLQNQKYKAYQHTANQPSPTPYSGAYDTDVNNLTNYYNQTSADIAGQQLGVEQQYGITDKSNPYALARQLERDNAQRMAGTKTSYAASGQLYSGALNNANDANRYAFGQAQDEMVRAYQAAKGDLAREQLQAQQQYNEGLASAYAGRLEEGLQQPVDPASAPKPPKKPHKPKKNKK